MVLLLEARPAAETADSAATISDRLRQLAQSENLSEKEALKRIAKERGVSKSDLWRELQRERARHR